MNVHHLMFSYYTCIVSILNGLENPIDVLKTKKMLHLDQVLLETN